MEKKILLSGNEAVGLAAHHLGVHLGVGYPGTPSSEILEEFAEHGGKAQWAPNEKVALEVAIGAAFAGRRAMATMKHVGLNVAADPLFTVAYTGISSGLVVIVCDDPGMWSSQNEQDSRRYAIAAGVPMLEPSDSQEAYDFLEKAFEISEYWDTLVMLRMTTRVCHSKTVVIPRTLAPPSIADKFIRDREGRVMMPVYARKKHRELRRKLDEIGKDHDAISMFGPVGAKIAIITSGVTFMHVLEAAPDALIVKINMIHPFPASALYRIFSQNKQVERWVVVEEGDPVITELCRNESIKVESKNKMYRFGELNVERVRRIIASDLSPEVTVAGGKPPQFCTGCPHRKVFDVLKEMNLIVAGDIGCYSIGGIPPHNAMDHFICMGASIGTGLGLRHVLPEEEARKVVSVIGDSTFWHSGLTGLVEAAYNPPKTGHVILALDNGTTAMTGLQEHPGTGYNLMRQPAKQLFIEEAARALGVDDVQVIDHQKNTAEFRKALTKALQTNSITVIVLRSPCILLLKRAKEKKGVAS